MRIEQSDRVEQPRELKFRDLKVGATFRRADGSTIFMVVQLTDDSDVLRGAVFLNDGPDAGRDAGFTHTSEVSVVEVEVDAKWENSRA